MDPNVNVETGEALRSRSPRFAYWLAFLVFSIITLASAVQVMKASEDRTSASKYAVACASVTFFLTTVVVAMHFSPVTTAIFVGTKVEGIVTIVLVVFWMFIVAVNTDATDGLAFPDGSEAQNGNDVQNGNLYYFSWAGFIMSFILFTSFLRDAFGLDVMDQVRNRGARLHYWTAFFACSIVVMGSGSRTLRNECGADSQQTDSFCRKTKFAISVGSVSFVFALLVLATKLVKTVATTAETTPFVIEFAFAFFLTVLNTFGVGYTTSAGAPGSKIGNLYYFSWASFLLAAVLLAECYTEFAHPPQPQQYGEYGENGTHNGNGTRPDSGAGGTNIVMVEQFDDTI